MGRRRFRTHESYRRRAPTREPYDAVLIVCEGQKTEPQHFEGLKSSYRLSSANIVIEPMGKDPLSLVKYAIAELERDATLTHAYCVFDRDGHATFNEAVSKARDSVHRRSGRLRLAVSVPCFEIWPLLHFGFTTAPIVASHGHSPGEVALARLQQAMPDYSKSDRAIFGKLADKMDVGMKNALRLAAHNRKTHSDNPSTDVHTLVEYLRRLKQ